MSETDNQATEDDWGAAMAEQAGAAANAAADDGQAPAGDVSAAGMNDLVAEQNDNEPGSLENILDIPVTLSVEIAYRSSRPSYSGTEYSDSNVPPFASITRDDATLSRKQITSTSDRPRRPA